MKSVVKKVNVTRLHVWGCEFQGLWVSVVGRARSVIILGQNLAENNQILHRNG